MGMDENHVNVAGKNWIVTRKNLDQFLGEMQASINLIARALEKRGYPQLAGRYSISVLGKCNGGDYDISRLFEITNSDGKSSRMQEIALTQDRYAVELLFSGNPRAQLPAVAVEDALVIGNLIYEAFNFWGTIIGTTIEIRFDEEQLKSLYGRESASEADWETVRSCFVRLAPASP